MPNTSQISPTVVSCYGGLVLNRDIIGKPSYMRDFRVNYA